MFVFVFHLEVNKILYQRSLIIYISSWIPNFIDFLYEIAKWRVNESKCRSKLFTGKCPFSKLTSHIVIMCVKSEVNN